MEDASLNFDVILVK